MVWYLGLVISAILAFLMALRAMRDYQEDPDNKTETDYGLFLIRHPQALDEDLINKLAESLKGYICSLERIKKGSDEAIVGYFPYFVATKFPSLGLIEIEDYILGRSQTQADPFILSRQISLDDSFTWKLQSKKKQSNQLSLQGMDLQLSEDQYIAWQIVFTPIDKEFQITPRVIVKEQNSQQKIELIKKVRSAIDRNTSLTSGTALIHTGVYEDYKKRTLVPKQVQAFLITPREMMQFINA